AVAEHQVHATYFVLSGIEVGAFRCDASLIAVPQVKMQANFSEALEANAPVRPVKLLVILLHSNTHRDVRNALVLGTEHRGLRALDAGLRGFYLRTLSEQRTKQLRRIQRR